jgi:hypothetical protein
MLSLFARFCHKCDSSIRRQPFSPSGFPQAVIRMTQDATGLQRCNTQAALEHKCAEDAPWDFILGFDEFTPGNKLDGKNSRKTMTNLHPNT